jgi:hypothetical protein
MLRRPNKMSLTINQINTMIQRNTITFENPLQRPADQWKLDDKNLLIDSLVRMFVPDIYVIKSSVKNEEGRKIEIYDVIDGLQRLTTISSYLADKWALSELEPIELETTGEVYNISGKKFSELPEDVQSEITGYSLEIKYWVLEDEEDEENLITDIFYRLNNGKGMSREHLALVSAGKNIQQFVRRVLTEHKLFTKIAYFTPDSIKKSGREITVMQSIILISGLDYESFASKDVELVFANSNITEDVLKRTEQTFSDIIRLFPKYSKHVSKVNIPILAYVLANTSDEDKEEVMASILKYFNEDTKKGDAYKICTGAGSVKKEKVRGRITALQNICEIEKSLKRPLSNVESI